MATVTNRRYAQAVNGESVWVLLDGTDSAKLSTFELGDTCTIAGSKTGYIDFIDTFGHTLRIKPNMPTNAFNSQNTLGYLESGEVITIS